MSNFVKPYKIKNIDINKLVIGKIQGNDQRKKCKLRYKNGKDLNSFIIQTPELYNFSKPIDKGNYWEIELPLFGKSNTKINQFKQFLRNLSTKIINEARQKNKLWFSNIKNVRYKSIIRNSDIKSNYNTNGVIKLKIIKPNANCIGTRLTKIIKKKY